MADDKLGVGLVGMGGFGHFLLREWSKLDDIRLIAGSDENLVQVPKIESFRFYRDYHDLLEDPQVQIVSIAAPPSTHVPIALDAIEKGKNVLIEKPVALTAMDGKKVEEAARSAGVVATVDFMLRFNPLVEGMKKVIESGVFGKPRRLDLRNYATQDTVPPGHWFWNHEVSGGILIEHGVHFFDMSSYLIDSSAVEATGLSVWRNQEQEDRMFAAVKFDNDVIGTYWHSFSRPMALETTTFHMAFDLGEVEISGWIPLNASFFGWTDELGIDALKKYLPGLDLSVSEIAPVYAQSSDQAYPVSASVKGTAGLLQPKMEVYGDLVREMMMDIVKAVRDPGHKLRVNMDDAIAAVAVAEHATKAAHSELMLPVW